VLARLHAAAVVKVCRGGWRFRHANGTVPKHTHLPRRARPAERVRSAGLPQQQSCRQCRACAWWMVVSGRRAGGSVSSRQWVAAPACVRAHRVSARRMVLLLLLLSAAEGVCWEEVNE
jgi:hypothetical protein